MTGPSEVQTDLTALLERHSADDDPLNPFLRTYLQMTRHVVGATGGSATAASRFRDTASVTRLTEVFAEYFFAAVRRPAEAPRCWQVLFESRPGVPRPLARALVGMNAHINYDLALAVVDTCREMKVVPEDGSAFHADFLTVNEVLGEAFDEVKPMLMTGALASVDGALGRVDDSMGLWSIERARDAAWIRARVLWSLQGLGPVREAYLVSHDRMVALVGRSLLVAGAR